MTILGPTSPFLVPWKLLQESHGNFTAWHLVVYIPKDNHMFTKTDVIKNKVKTRNWLNKWENLSQPSRGFFKKNSKIGNFKEFLVQFLKWNKYIVFFYQTLPGELHNCNFKSRCYSGHRQLRGKAVMLAV